MEYLVCPVLAILKCMYNMCLSDTVSFSVSVCVFSCAVCLAILSVILVIGGILNDKKQVCLMSQSWDNVANMHALTNSMHCSVHNQLRLPVSTVHNNIVQCIILL